MSLGLSEYCTTYDGEKVLLRTVDSYAPTGNYLLSDKVMVEKRNVTFDENGVPMVNFRWGTHYYPITTAQYALQHHALYLTTQSSESYQKFISMAEYFLETQDEKGGWSTNFDHSFYRGRTEIIVAPWYSAMAQGQVLSTLVRAFSITGDDRYLSSAKRGLMPYAIPVEFGGALRRFEDGYWFEEYPTTPPSYVLNGFIFSLFGLYDLHKTCDDVLAEQLYNEGISTLRKVISFYDLGNRTAYDLTHLATSGAAPNVARWGYHSTHVLEMSAICCIQPEEQIFKEVLERWIGYLRGVPAKTN